MKKIAFLFPGQGSQSIGMLSELASTSPIIQETVAEASQILKYDLWKLIKEGSDEQLNKTETAQPALLAAGVAIYRLWIKNQGARPILMAGHSLGEYTALVCAESIAFSDAIELVKNRGQLMQNAVPEGKGAMVAIIGLDDNKILEICSQASQGQIIAPANYNSPGQTVLAGEIEAVQRAAAIAKTAGAKMTKMLNVSVPSHCELMRDAAIKLQHLLDNVEIKTPAIPVIHNADVKSHTDPTDIRNILAAQLYSPVLWTQTIHLMQSNEIEYIFECGPGKVLTGLNKRIVSGMLTDFLGMPENFQRALELTK